MPERSYRILQVNLRDRRGGAAQVAANLHRMYRARGIDAKMAVARKYSTDGRVFEIPHDRYEPAGIRHIVRLGRKLQTDFTPIRGAGRLGGALIEAVRLPQRARVWRGREDFHAPGTAHLLEMGGPGIDILHLHNLHKAWLTDRREYFDLGALPYLSAKAPVIITLHDAWLMSGHCAHSVECERWRCGCGDCPDLGSYPAFRRDATAYNWQRKREIFRKSRLHLVSPSQWLLDKARDSMLWSGVASARLIPNGIDLTVFHPGARDRVALGLPANANVVLFSADGIRSNKLKDFDTLSCAIAQAAERIPNLVLVALGEAGPASGLGKAELRYVAYQDNPEVVARFYRAVDVYIHAARADTFPNSVIEALACGTPVVATRVGGIPEQVREGETGFLADPGDATDMAAKMERLFVDPELRRRMGRAAADDAQVRFDLRRQVDEYLACYDEAMARDRSTGRPAVS